MQANSNNIVQHNNISQHHSENATIQIKMHYPEREAQISAEEKLHLEIQSYPGAAAIIRHCDDKPVFCNERMTYVIGSRANDWIGQDISQQWQIEELKDFKRLLRKEQHLNNFEYINKLSSGETCKLNVDARLVMYRGDLCRVEKVISCEFIA